MLHTLNADREGGTAVGPPFDMENEMKTIHYVGFRGDEYVRAYRIWGGPVMIHKVYDERVFTEVGEEDIVIFGPQYKYSHYVWDASGDM